MIAVARILLNKKKKEKKKKNNPPRLQTVLQSYGKQNCMVLSQKQT